MNFIKIFLSTVFIISTFFTASAQDIKLMTQAEVDAFDSSITTIKGNLTIGEYLKETDIKNLDGLSGLTVVGGSLYIVYNNSLRSLDGLSGVTTVGGNLEISYSISLRSLDGLSGLTTVGGCLEIEDSEITSLSGLSGLTTVGGYLSIFNNPSLTNCCGIQALLSKPGAIKGKIAIEYNATTCDSKETILSASCSSDSPDEGTTVTESNYKENLYKLTRWELASCGSNLNYKFTQDGKLTQNGAEYGIYTIEGKNLTLSPTGGTAQTYTIFKMTTNVMHLKDGSGTETIYGRKQHVAGKLSGTNWKEKGGVEDGMRMNFIDESKMEFIRIGSKGSKMEATYILSSDNKKMTIKFLDEAKAKEQNLLTKLVLDIKTFNFMMMKMEMGNESVCFNRVR